VSYPQSFVREIIAEHCVPVQINNALDESKQIVQRYRHVWTPDLRIIHHDGYELYRWNGYLPPAEFAAQLLVGLGHARLRLREFDKAELLFADALKRFPTALVAPEAQYFAGVNAYRKSGEGKDLLHGWHLVETTYPNSEWAVKQNFD
jgi:hypothetical protein